MKPNRMGCWVRTSSTMWAMPEHREKTQEELKTRLLETLKNNRMTAVGAFEFEVEFVPGQVTVKCHVYAERI